MNKSDFYSMKVYLPGGGRDLAALKAALGNSWEDCGMGLREKKGLANRTECIIVDDNGYMEIVFKGKKYVSDTTVLDEVIVPIGD